MIGQLIGRYRIVSLIGEGGMGSVYLGEHCELHRKAAIKVLRRDLVADAVVVRRFSEEARAASAVAHPNIVDVHDVGTLPDGLPYMIMEYLVGENLGARLARNGRLEIEHALSIAAQTAGALEAVHAKGIIHRDLKPDNLFLVPDPMLSHDRVKVLDFGIAKLRGNLADDVVKTRSGAVLGTPRYMSPEQCRGLGEAIDHRTDIYSLGVILYQMVCGEPPFGDPSFTDVLLKHLTAPPPAPRGKNPAISARLEALILCALAKRPEDRWASMTDFRRALGATGVRTLVTPLHEITGVPARVQPATKILPVATGATTDRVGHTPTTLSGATGQTFATGRHGARSTLLVLGALGLAAGVAWMLLPEHPRGPAVERTPVLPAPPPEPVPPPLPEPIVTPPPPPTPAVIPAATEPVLAAPPIKAARPRPRPTRPPVAPPPEPTPPPPLKIESERW